MDVLPIQTNMRKFCVCLYTLVIKYLRFCISHFLQLVLLSRNNFGNKNISSLCKNRKSLLPNLRYQRLSAPYTT